MSVMYIRNEQTGEFEPVPSLVGPQGPPGLNGDGAGTVTSVNKVAPDAAGNVTLTAADVGALPSGGTAVDADKLNGKSADKYASYEYGIWTPKLTYLIPTSDPVYTANNTTGTYVKIGPMVYATWSSELNITSGGAGSDRAIISGLPFASNANFLGASGFFAGYYVNSGYTENPRAYIAGNYVELGYGSSWKEANGYGAVPIIIAAVYLTDQ